MNKTDDLEVMLITPNVSHIKSLYKCFTFYYDFSSRLYLSLNL